MEGRHFPGPNKCKLRSLNQGVSCQRAQRSHLNTNLGDLGGSEGPMSAPPRLLPFLQAIFFGGIDVSIRGEVWPFLLRYYSAESTSEEREALRAQKRKEYAEIQRKR